MSKTAIGRWGPVVLWMGLIFYLSSQSKPPLGWLADTVDYGDKLAHMAVYGVLGGLLWRALRNTCSQWSVVGIVTLIALAYGLSDETHQLFVPGRSFDLLDMTADGIGAALAAVILTIRWGGCTSDRRTGSGEDL